MESRYIVIEGPIGVGKSSLARLLAREFQARLILEKVEDNPFLDKFYRDRRQFAFQTQIFFLLSRYRQLEALHQQDLFSQVAISDYFMPKDHIFATLNLSPEELALYEQIYAQLNPRIPRPDLVIFLQADTDVLLQRIRIRDRKYEKQMERDYLRDLNQKYTEYFFNYHETPLLVVQTSNIDFVNRREDLEDLACQIRQMKSGVQYYSPPSR